MIQLLFVCLGNICRSPALMGYMNHLAAKKGLSKKVYIDSCGLHASFLGSPPDQRMQMVAKEKGILFDHQAKIFESAFFDIFDAIFGVTHDVVSYLQSLAHTKETFRKIHLVTDYSRSYKGIDMPDPYYLGTQGFVKIWDMIEESCQGIYQEFLSQT